MRPLVRGRAESLALKTDIEGNDKGRRAAARLCRLCVAGAQGMHMAASSLLYLQ